ncbi:MAG: hypothetical protein HY232_01490 [Acidobacteria bacterium]|nr:hypothetical protein [Acidobacteriota bacterium]
MKNRLKLFSVLGIALLGVLWLASLAAAAQKGSGKGKAAAGEQTIEGTLVDTKCYLGGGFKGNDHMGQTKCGTMCAKSGLPVAVLDSKDALTHLMVPAPSVAEHIGMKVRAKGKLDKKSASLTADSLEVNKDGKWEPVNIKSMM